MKKIAIVVNSIGIGGNERSALNIAGCLKQFSDVRIIIQENTGSVGDAGVPVYCLKTAPKRGIVGKVLNSIVRALKLYTYILYNRIDAVLLILPTTNILNYLKYPCKKYLSCRACGDLVRNSEKYARMTKSAEAIVFNSHYMKQYFAERYPELKDKGIAIHNILDASNTKLSMQEEIENEEFERFVAGRKVIVSVGRFCEEKAFGHLIKSFSLLHSNQENVALVLIGDGALRENVSKLISELRLDDAVLLLGYQKNPHKYMARCNVFALSSYSEGFPNVIPEAMACGLVVVSTDCASGPKEILAPMEHAYTIGNISIGEYGVLTQVFANDGTEWDSQAINEQHRLYAEALSLAISDVSLVEQYSQKGKERIDDFSIEKKLEEWRTLFESDY